MNLETITAVSSFLLSAGLVVREIYKNQARFDIAYSFNGDPSSNDIIALYNKSTKPVIINNIQLFKNYNSSKEKELDIGLFGEFILVSVNPNSTYSLELSEQYKFRIDYNETISLKLKIMGKKRHVIIPILFR